MPSPYTIEQTAEASGLSIKFIRRLKAALPELFAKHTERGQSNAILFDEEILEILKRTKDLKNRGRTLQQIRDELAQVAERHKVKEELAKAEEGSNATSEEEVQATQFASPMRKVSDTVVVQSLHRENEMLRSQVTFLQDLIRKAEARFDRLLPEATGENSRKSGMKSQLMMWLVEAAVVTVFAAGFIFMIWLFAQRAFSL